MDKDKFVELLMSIPQSKIKKDFLMIIQQVGANRRRFRSERLCPASESLTGRSNREAC